MGIDLIHETAVFIIYVKYDENFRAALESKKAGSTLRCSRTVPQSSTDRALQRLTSEFGRDPVYSVRYGRQRIYRCEVAPMYTAFKDL